MDLAGGIMEGSAAVIAKISLTLFGIKCCCPSEWKTCSDGVNDSLRLSFVEFRLFSGFNFPIPSFSRIFLVDVAEWKGMHFWYVRKVFEG
jgi:hypothetical protein